LFQSITKTLAQLGDPRLRRVLILAVLSTFALIAALAFGVGWAVSAIGQTGIGWLDAVLPWLAGIGAFAIALLLFPGSVQVLSGLFLDSVADAVEDRFYPDLPAPRPQPLGEIIAGSLAFAGISIALNLLVLPLYLVLPGLNLVLFAGLNGYLLGREYAELVGARRMDARSLKQFRQANRGNLFTGGVVIALTTLVPVVNLATPVLATAFALHEHQRLRAGHAQG